MKNNKIKKDLLNRDIIGFVGYAINSCKKLVVYNKDHTKNSNENNIKIGAMLEKLGVHKDQLTEDKQIGHTYYSGCFINIKLQLFLKI